jgi:hypothetical protein
MKKVEVSWTDDRYGFLHDARKLAPNKTGFNGLRYMFGAVITVGDDGFATDCKLKNRNYDLGTWHKWDFCKRAGLDSEKQVELVSYHETPSKVKSKLKSRGIEDVIVSSLEGSIAMRCIETYNDGVRWERQHKLQLDFESRCDGFLAELDKLKKKYALNVKVDTYVNDYDEAEIDFILEDKSNLSDHVHEKYVTNELGFES